MALDSGNEASRVDVRSTDDAARRQAALASYGILDTDREEDFDDLVALAAQICGVPIAAMSFLDAEGGRQWFKAETGLGVRQTEMEAAFCVHAADAGEEVFVVEDATRDDRFAGNRLVLGEPGVRFYAGAPLRTSQGVALGTVCVIDRAPRRLSEAQLDALRRLSRQAIGLLEGRRDRDHIAVIAAQREAALQQAAAATRHFSAVFDHARVGMLLVGSDGVVTAANGAFASMIGERREDIAGRGFTDLTAPEDVDDERRLFAGLVSSARASVVREKRYRHAGGRLVAAVSSSVVIAAGDGRPLSVLSQVESIEDRRRAEEALLESQSAVDAIVTVDAEGRIVAWNRGAERLFGHDRQNALGRPATLIVPARHRPAHLAGLARAATGASARMIGHTVELDALHADGTELPVELSLSSWQRAGQSLFTAVIRDVSERRRLQAELLERAGTDALTRTANRSRLTSQLTELLADPVCAPVAVVVFDLDGFGTVNRGFGSDIGDGLLVAVARRVGTALRPTDLLGRVGSDEYAILLPATTLGKGEVVAERIGELLRAPFDLRGVRVTVDATFGVAAHPGRLTVSGSEQAAPRLLRNAAVALGDARSAPPGGRIRRYRPASQGAARRRLVLHEALRHTIDRAGATSLPGVGEHAPLGLHLAYQPQVNLATGRLRGVEALARWEHPTLGTVKPVEFVALAEDTGLAHALGAWVLHQACAQAALWSTEARRRRIGMSVNVSGHQLGDDRILHDVTSALDAAGLDAEALTVEVTESVVMADPAGAARRLSRLRDLGVHVAIDDFGTGYSNLASLISLPLDELKIDRSFVTPLPADTTAARAVTTVIDLARALGALTVAEGIETAEQHRFLLDAGCDTGQGYFFSRPLLTAALDPWLHQSLRALA